MFLCCLSAIRFYFLFFIITGFFFFLIYFNWRLITLQNCICLDFRIIWKIDVLSCSVVSDSLQPHGCSPPGSSVHRDSPGKNTHALLQGIFPIQGLNPGLPHCMRILDHLSHHSIFTDWRCSVTLRWSGVLLFQTYVSISIIFSSPKCSKIYLTLFRIHYFYPLFHPKTL